MQVVYAKQPFPDEWYAAIFLAGPTPRDANTPSWRPEALRHLEEIGFAGVVMVPEAEDGEWKSGPDAYVEQVEWERRGLDLCDVAVFWVPREMPDTPARVYPPVTDQAREMLKTRGFGLIEDSSLYEDEGDGQPGPAWERKVLDDPEQTSYWVPVGWSAGMPALTTNVEFGRYVTSDKVVLGAPQDAKSIKYLEQMMVRDLGLGERHTSLRGTLEAAVKRIGQLTGVDPARPAFDRDALIPGPGGAPYLPVLRVGGERCVPLHIWTLGSFQDWYRSQVAAGNRLDDARVLWHFRMPRARFVFSWVLQVSIWVESEQRHKANEWVFARTDISTVCLYRWPTPPSDGLESITDVEVVLIREFRSPARTPDGMVHELAGGSSMKPGQNPLQVASEEVHEETGLIVPATRFRSLGSRQVAGTLSAHHAHLFAAELSASEMAEAKVLAEAQTAHGVVEDTERTYVEVTTFGALLGGSSVDWATVGMVAQAILRGSDGTP